MGHMTFILQTKAGSCQTALVKNVTTWQAVLPTKSGYVCPKMYSHICELSHRQVNFMIRIINISVAACITFISNHELSNIT